jgi:hypothetical protein
MCMTIDRAVGREVQGAPRANRPARVSFPDMDTNHLYAHLRPESVLIIDDINTATIDRCLSLSARRPWPLCLGIWRGGEIDIWRSQWKQRSNT